MSAQMFVNHVELLLAAAVLVALFYGPWQSFVLEVLRQNLFNLRDSLFLVAADRKISFESPEYRAIRERFNMMIRYAHTLNWSHVLAHIICKPRDVKAFDINELVARIENPEVAKMVLGYYQRAMIYAALAIVARSLFLLITNMVFFPFAIVLLMLNARKINERVGRAINTDIDVEQGRKQLVAAS